ncbi:hypothetical protein GQ457_02G014140 [Hibiscus cannabinus]
MFSYPPQITESQPGTKIHDTHASLVGGLPAGRPPDSIPSIVDPLEATMTEAEADLIMPVSMGKEIVGVPAMVENNQSGQQLSFKDMLLGKSVDTVSKGVEELDVEVGADDVRIAMNGLVPEIHFSDKVHRGIDDKLANSLIVRLLGKSIGYRALLGRVQSLWNPMGDIQPWSRSFSTDIDHPSQIVSWVRLPGLPYRYYTRSLIKIMAGVIGDVVKIDFNTSEGKRDGRSQHIEYEGLPSICYGCGRYGHSKDVCSYAKSGQGPVGGLVISVVDGAPTVESRQAATELYGPWMHVTGRRRRAAGNKRDSIDNRLGADHGLNDDTGSEGDHMATRAGIMHDGVNMAGKAKKVNTNRSRQTRFAGGNSSMAFTKSVVNRPTITTNGPGECSSENPVVLIEDPVIGSAGGNSIMQSNHRGLSVSKNSSKKGARIRRLADVRKSTLPILGEWVNSITRELSNAADPPGVVSSIDKENVHVHQDLIEASVH